jgi:hypothetical protein
MQSLRKGGLQIDLKIHGKNGELWLMDHCGNVL